MKIVPCAYPLCFERFPASLDLSCNKILVRRQQQTCIDLKKVFNYSVRTRKYYRKEPMTKTQRLLIKLKKQLITHQLSFADLSRHSGISEGAISRGFTGKTLAMKPETLQVLQFATGELIHQKKG